MFQRPSCREDFEVAIICASPLEYDAVIPLFDEFWDQEGDKFGRAAGDPNTYTTGRIGKHSVVLALLCHMGKANAAAAAASMRSSYTALRLLILTGICGGVPFNGEDEMILGDVVISKTIIQYDFGKKYPNEFMRKDTVEDNLGKPNKNIGSFLAVLNTESGLHKLEERTAHFLKQLQEKYTKDQAKYRYPGTAQDKLFESSYRHKHRNSVACICNNCHGTRDPVCEEALSLACDYLECDEEHLVVRKRLGEKEEQGKGQRPAIHIGVIASGDTLMKSGEDRDRISRRESVIAFEMEGAGVWEEIPCIVVKGVCDYADSHKNDQWRNFAAATAASTSKAILERYIPTDRVRGRLIEEPPKGHFLVPFGRNQNFIGRSAIVSGLMEKIRPEMNKDDCQRIAIEGLGGAGKTQIALEAVYIVHNEHPDCSIFWVPAVDAASFESAYHDIAKRLKIKDIDDDKVDIKPLIKAALSEESNGSWLLVLDNADDIALLFGAAGLLTYLPFSRKGSILLTTRNHEVAIKLDTTAESIFRVAEMDNGEALSLLQTGLNESQISNQEATKMLLHLLTNLPLAIKQASAYMATNDISTQDYLELCQSEPRDMIDLLSRDFEDRYRYRGVQNPVVTTWLISFSQISQQDKLAAEYLKCMSILADKGIPKALLPKAGKLAVTDAIGTLKAYAFITQREGEESFDMHRLVRLATQNWLEKKGELKECVTSTIQRLNNAVPFPVHKNRDIWMKYLAHVQAALELPEYITGSEAEADLFYKAAGGNFLLGWYRKAEQMFRQALEFREKMSGTDHPYTLTVISQIANALYKQGRYEESEQIYRQLLNLRERVLGKIHPDTLDTMNNLANALSDQGKNEEAEKMHRETLELRDRVLGEDHPDTHGSMNGLAIVLYNVGKYEDAERMNRQTLKLQEKVLGKHHPYTLDMMNNLGNALSIQGKYKEAEQMHQQTLELREKVLGKAHPDTIISMNGLADAIYKQGEHKEAERMFRQILKVREEVLGKNHPHTLASINNLATMLHRLGKYEAAEQMHRQALELRENSLGKDHPNTLESISNLATVLQDMGKYEDAGQMHQQALNLRERMLGKAHPDTLTSMNNLAIMLRHLGKYKEAEQINRQALNLREKALGSYHPDTLESMNSLTSMLYKQGKYKEAEPIYRQILKLRKAALGINHPDTLNSINNLAAVLEDLGQHNEASQMHREALELREQLFGKDHPHTLASMNNLANALSSQGKYEEAEQMHRQTLKLRERKLGKNHPDTFHSMNNLANALSSQSKHEEAEQMHRQTLELREKVLGKDHADTLSSMNNLAYVLFKLNKYQQVEQIYRWILELHEKVLGKDHPETLRIMNNLGYVLSKFGHYKEAEQILQQTLELYDRALGKEHPGALETMDSLATMLSDMGKYEEAERMYRQTLELREKVLGKDHPQTQNSQDHLTNFLKEKVSKELQRN